MTDEEQEQEFMRMGEYVLVQIQALSIHIDQLGAELKDPETPAWRRDVVQAELRQWYDTLKEVAGDR